MAETTMAQALSTALHDAMRRSDRVILFGRGAGQFKRAFDVTAGLSGTFGPWRGFDTQSSEAENLAAAVGMALYGYRPVIELRLGTRADPPVEQTLAELARMRTCTRGRVGLPIVLRVPYGGGVGEEPRHDISSSAFWAHVPGLHTVAPANVADAYSLLREAIDSPDPVVFLEPERLYWETEAVALPVRTQPFGRAAVRRPGTTATLIACGASVPVAVAAAEVAAAGESGQDVEVIDLRTLAPFDDATVVESVKRTGRAVVVHESHGFHGVGAEIAARIAERCFDELKAPVLRVTGWDIPSPAPNLEKYHLPSVDRVLRALHQVLRVLPGSPDLT
ncbi:alpha-ketoacid dehydrogenase subunit beta [Allokutzneria albata]|uniref:Pyruvate dehydrogenase E1 component beta subunit n=1 Tax=Allokutzneria albata TaxID=211114 RepID=A0A1H0CGU4_ALLAB|nr:transketolase C-terminal domain-containing protein [Allokutzneria albata]SDN57104.1 pyruvate dehydrogenase E1 component beta subunit [Allokutzneria albata]